MTSAIVAFAAFSIGLVIGIGIGGVTADTYISKKTYREWKRNLVKHGFWSDGVEYEVRPVKGESRTSEVEKA